MTYKLTTIWIIYRNHYQWYFGRYTSKRLRIQLTARTMCYKILIRQILSEKYELERKTWYFLLKYISAVISVMTGSFLSIKRGRGHSLRHVLICIGYLGGENDIAKHRAEVLMFFTEIIFLGECQTEKAKIWVLNKQTECY